VFGAAHRRNFALARVVPFLMLFLKGIRLESEWRFWRFVTNFKAMMVKEG
jgi:hypothetical protein